MVKYTDTNVGAASADLFSNVGGAGDLAIRSLWSSIPDRDLRLAFTEGVADADNMTLHVGGLALEFPEGSSGNGSFKWTEVDVDWEDGETIAVRIDITSPSTDTEAEEPEAEEPETERTGGQYPGRRPAHHQRHPAGRGDADSERCKHRRRRRVDHRFLQIPVAGRGS